MSSQKTATPTQVKNSSMSRAEAKNVARLTAIAEAKQQLTATELSTRGLSEAQVSERIAAGLDNVVPNESSRSILQILRANLVTLFNIVLGACFVVVLLVGDWKDALFGVIVIANAAIGVIQEYRAKRTLDKLAVLHAPHARVLRQNSQPPQNPQDKQNQSETRELPLAEVVYQDVLVLRTGDQIPADAVVLSTEGLELDESLLTGESDPVDKSPGDEVLSGSAVVSGSGTARVERIGVESFAAKLTAEAKRFSLVNSEIRRSINKIVLYITWALIPLVLLVINGQMQAKGGWGTALETGAWKDAVVSAVASIVAMIPEGLVLLTSISFGLAAVTLARRQVLVQELPAVEGLARVDIVCLDKTGTLTEGEIIFDAEYSLQQPPGWHQVLGWIGADENANATAACLRSEYLELPAIQPTAKVPFNSARKWSAVSFGPNSAQGNNDGGSQVPLGSWVFGAPEMVLEQGQETHRLALEQASRLAEQGLRALILAHSPEPLGEAPAEGGLPKELQAVAILTFREKVRPDASETLAYFREQGVSLRVISGDNPRTVAAVAREVGFENVGQGYDARQLPQTFSDQDIDELGEVLEKEQVLGRVTPEQKKFIVLALQKRGHVVAMTGDGVNDALALKNADIGIAMGSGAAATKAVARLVLLDGQFSRMPGVVAEGRRVIANVERVANLFLTKTAYAIMISLFIGIMLWQYPFLPRQLSIVSSLTIGIPAFFLALLPNKRRYQPGFLRRVLFFSIPAGAIIAVSIVAVYGYSRAFPDATLSAEAQLEAGRTATTAAVLLIALWVLGTLARPFDRWRAAVVAAMVLGLVLVLAVPFAREFFALQVPTGWLLAVTIGVVILGCAAVEILYRILKRRGAVSERV
ncbi:cation-transporting ATPase E [Psychromicrobium silvestre]|uniref:Cation-transporting ATPase E n=1 Tax=Psychromicrobium silvestre TaxID=1645614 RepID=A0A7Y9LR49_9MICC|nr:HAD-IC family P-type ATPase [Psychromicrobium silvestre]NYE94062.1 cation-transporting ATPase E [Psychromicrobium silvestre]